MLPKIELIAIYQIAQLPRYVLKKLKHYAFFMQMQGTCNILIKHSAQKERDGNARFIAGQECRACLADIFARTCSATRKHPDAL